ncbi:hypothetical protein GJR96_01615 [Haloferax sp. MBLA0076]|uniref:DUF7310 domain-containing protein n=1 Tax=Haloferax litoreum TaxID=2666140 RepID=A0A6A8GFT3_9EURY|nr:MULTISPECIES: hypothetical protein [Haloferax]KAB1192208.1 hypothetical protein Hfx1148_01605 [Haloferax sp. CBA1148]MRX20660.1 hypothetical protein [Haloferax litoreum]
MTPDTSAETHDGFAHAVDRTDELVSRLEAVERTVTGTDTDVSSLEDVAAIEDRLSAVESTVESLSERLDEVDAATQAVRGYLGGVRTVNEDVERRANAALAKAESLESALVDESETTFESAAIEQQRAPDAEPPQHRRSRPDDQHTSADNTRGLAARLRDVL